MKTISMLLTTCWLLLSAGAFAADADPHEAVFKDQIQSLANDNFSQFINHGTDQFRAAMNEAQFHALSKKLQEKMAKGYTSSYLGHLKQKGYDVHLWKISYVDSSDDSLVNVVFDGDQIAGFWLQ